MPLEVKNSGLSERKRQTGSRRAEGRPRRCLKCGRGFRSKGAHHRICLLCTRIQRIHRAEDPEADNWLGGEAGRERREGYLRALMVIPQAEGSPASFFAGAHLRFRTCQWIAGEPGADEACKCGAVTRDGAAYCAQHSARATCAAPAEAHGRPEDSARAA